MDGVPGAWEKTRWIAMRMDSCDVFVDEGANEDEEFGQERFRDVISGTNMSK